jgi:hypothetical protein
MIFTALAMMENMHSKKTCTVNSSSSTGTSFLQRYPPVHLLFTLAHLCVLHGVQITGRAVRQDPTHQTADWCTPLALNRSHPNEDGLAPRSRAQHPQTQIYLTLQILYSFPLVYTNLM